MNNSGMHCIPLLFVNNVSLRTSPHAKPSRPFRIPAPGDFHVNGNGHVADDVGAVGAFHSGTSLSSINYVSLQNVNNSLVDK